MRDFLNHNINRFEELSQYIPNGSELTVRMLSDGGCWDIDLDVKNGKLVYDDEKPFEWWDEVVRIKHLSVTADKYDEALKLMQGRNA